MATKNFLSVNFPSILNQLQNARLVVTTEGTVVLRNADHPWPELRAYCEELAVQLGVNFEETGHTVSCSKNGRYTNTPSLKALGQNTVVSFGDVNHPISLAALLKKGWRFTMEGNYAYLENDEYEYKGSSDFTGIIPVKFGYDEVNKQTLMPSGLTTKQLAKLANANELAQYLQQVRDRPLKMSSLPSHTDTYMVTGWGEYAGYQGAKEFYLVIPGHGKVQAAGKSKARLLAEKPVLSASAPAFLAIHDRTPSSFKNERGETVQFERITHSLQLPTDFDMEAYFAPTNPAPVVATTEATGEPPF
jgi:hypothetical protein